MEQDWKRDSQQYVSYLKLLSEDVVNHRARENARRDATEFSTAFHAGKCSVCKGDLTSYARHQPCIHWLLKPEGFEKSDFLKITSRFSMRQIEHYIRRVANQDGFAKNINDLRDEGCGRLVELTVKYKDLEWAISCAQSDYDGHQSENEDSKKSHYHFQMRVDQKRYIDYADFHIPLHRSDVLMMEAERSAPGYITQPHVGGEGMRDVFTEKNIEQLAIFGKAAEKTSDGLVKFDHIVTAEKGRPMRAEDVLAAAREAHAQGIPATESLRKLPNVRVVTIAKPGPGVVHQAVRGRRGRGRKPTQSDLDSM